MAKHLLVVDDENELREIICLIMEDEGILTKSAINGQEALNLLLSSEGQDVCAVLSDIKMPIMDGLTLLKKIREKNLDIPVVILSAFGDKDKVVQALKWGAFDFQDKPFDRNRLVETVKCAMSVGEKLSQIDIDVEKMMIENKVPEDQKDNYREKIKALIHLRQLRKESA